MRRLNEQGWLTGVEHYPSPNFNERPECNDISLLVIHSISLPPDVFPSNDVIDFFLNRLDISKSPFYQEIKDMKVSAHFLIKRDGEVVQFVSVFDRAWHAGVSAFEERDNCNNYSVGIEMEGCDTIPFTDEQYKSLVELTHLLQRQFPKMTKDRIVSHAEIALPKGRKTDPGPLFDWNRYLKDVL